MHSKMSELTIKVKIQNVRSRKEKKVKITLPANKQINSREKIIEQLINLKKWDPKIDQISALGIRNEKKQQIYKVAATYLTIQKGDKFLLQRKRAGEPVKRKKVVRSSGSSSYSHNNDDGFVSTLLFTSMMNNTSSISHDCSFSHSHYGNM